MTTLYLNAASLASRVTHYSVFLLRFRATDPSHRKAPFAPAAPPYRYTVPKITLARASALALSLMISSAIVTPSLRPIR